MSNRRCRTGSQIGSFLNGLVGRLLAFEVEAAKRGFKSAAPVLLQTVQDVVKSAENMKDVKGNALFGPAKFGYAWNTLRGDLPGLVGVVADFLLRTLIEAAVQSLAR